MDLEVNSMIENRSGYQPLGRAVLVRMIQEKAEGLIAIPDQVKASMAVMEDRAEVIEIGSECWTDESQPRCEPGDKVIVTKFAGYILKETKDGNIYRLVNDRDVFARMVEN